MIQTTEFGRFPAVPSPDNLKPRPDRLALASVLRDESQMRVGELSAAGLRLETPRSEIFPHSLAYSTSGRLAYVAREAGQQFLVLNDEEQSRKWDAISDELGWSADGQSYSFVGIRANEVFVATHRPVAHGAQSAAQEWQFGGAPLPRRFAQNCDATQIAWLTQAKRQGLFLNGELHWEAEQFVENPVWSPDGKRLCFAFADAKGVTIRVDGRDFGPYPSLNKGTPVWSPDSQRCGWVIQRRGKSVVVVDGQETGLPFSVVQGGTLGFSPDGSRWSLSAHTGFLNLKGCVVVDGNAGPTFAALGTTAPVWNPQGDTLAYCAARELKTTFVVCGEREGQRCTSFVDGSLTWNPDGDLVGCIAQQEKKPCLVVEGRDGGSWSLQPEDGLLLRGDRVVFDRGNSLHDLGFRPDGSFFSWSAHF